MADIGYLSIVIASLAALYSAIAYIYGAKTGRVTLLQSARNGVIAVCVLLTASVVAMLIALVTHDFQIEYVASYTDRDLSLTYLLGALWAGNAGSLLFWAWGLSIANLVMVLQKREVGKELVPYAAVVTLFIQFFFTIILLFLADPFKKLGFTPADGNGLNPLLENAGMYFHPPFTLMGYLFFTIPFAFAMSALIGRRLGDEWIINIRRWTLIAWLFLTLGNLFGAWWAYVELGWGGYWAWDPVENASFMPWIVGTAFLHSIMMQRRRGILKIWNMALIIITFNLAILGTFLVRSNVLASVHSFAESPALGLSFLVFIIVALVVASALVYYRSRDLRSEAEMESLVSRESTFLLNNLLLVGAAFSILLGSFFPIISEAVRGVKISVGPPFYNQVDTPIFLAIILLSGICTLIGWRRASLKNLWRHFLWPAAGALVVGMVLFFVGIRQFYAVLGAAICGFVFFSIISEWVRGSIARHRMAGENFLKAFINLINANKPRYGGYIVHLGVVIFTIGVIGSSLYDVSKEVTIRPGDTVNLNNYEVTYERIDTLEKRTKSTLTATMTIRNGGEFLGNLFPEKYFHINHDQPVSEVAIRSTLKEDFYVILIGADEDGTAAFKFIINPLVSWLWIGGVVLVLGALVAWWPDRRGAVKSAESGRSEEG